MKMGTALGLGAIVLLQLFTIGLIMATKDEFITELQGVKDELDKVLGEVTAASAALLAKIQELQDALNNQVVPQEVLDKFAEVKAAADALDAVNPDVPPAP